MALDHYVPQVHLRRFYAPALGNRKLYAWRKSDGSHFTSGSRNICGIGQGSTNPYLTEPRLIEDFLKPIERNYNWACGALANGEITPDAVFVIAGFAASVTTCSPAAVRLATAPLEELLRVEAELLDRMGEIPKAPPELGGKTITQLFAEGAVKIETDAKYPQAQGIAAVLDHAKAYGNFHWDIVVNEQVDVPFFTSDFPVGVERSADNRLINRVVPLTPTLAIRIYPRIELAGQKLAPTLEHFSYRRLRPSRSEIVNLNRTIVRSAEDLVFSSINEPWVEPFVAKNAQWRVENETTNFRHGTGTMSMTRTVLRERIPAPDIDLTPSQKA